MPTILRNQAEAVSVDMGFSSLQDYIRLLLRKTLVGELGVYVGPKPIVLSARNDRRYNKMMDDINSGKEVVYGAKSADDLLDQLYGRKNPVRAKVSKKL